MVLEMKPSELIDKQIADLPDWRGQMYARLRKLVQEFEAISTHCDPL
jgi:hypothetical protein